MNPVFWLIVILVLVGIWFGLTALFKPLGGYLYEIFNDTKEVINEVEEVNKGEES
jgi:hypothetical protein